MLDFIVLGEIPGSSVQITFSMVAATALVLVLVFIFRRSARRNRLDRRSIQSFFDLVSI